MNNIWSLCGEDGLLYNGEHLLGVDPPVAPILQPDEVALLLTSLSLSRRSGLRCRTLVGRPHRLSAIIRARNVQHPCMKFYQI